MTDNVSPRTRALTEQELATLMESMGAACDVVRVVDPSDFKACTLASERDGFEEPYRCYSALGKSRRCENCISMRAAEEGDSASKFEFIDGEAYFITARPIELEGKTHTIELVHKVSDEVGMRGGVDKIQEHIQSRTDAEFIDRFTGTYSRNYFDEGLKAMRGRKLAMVQIDNLADINAENGHSAGDSVLKHVARELLMSTRIEDSVIHYEGNKFIVQFEDMDNDDFSALILEISDSANTTVVEGTAHVRPVARIAAIDRDATYGELAEQALSLLENAKDAARLVMMESSDEHHHAAPSIRAAAASESLHRPPDKMIADVDELTGFATSAAMRTFIQQLVRERHAKDEGYCVIYLDIENFKQFNRVYGTRGGDLLLKFVARNIKNEFPEGHIARMSGDIFLVTTCEPDIEQRLVRLHDAVASYQSRLTCRITAGVYRIDQAAHDAATVIDLAKVACESIKGRYDQSVRFYDSELDQEISMNEYVVNNIDRAIAEGHIKVYYQPIIRTMTGHVCDFEALARWDDPLHGLLSPAVFVGALEHFHLINKLDECVVRQACQHQAAMLAAGKQLVPISVNLSQLDFQLGDVFAMVESAVAEAGIPRSALTVEVTESAFNEDVEFFSGQIDRFLEAGYEVWMDDFGSGYSSLNLLKDYRFNTLKIDMAFLRSFDDNPKSREIIVTIVDMAKKLGIRTLIEGVETEQQYRFLRRIGCETLQGFFFGKPHPYDEAAFADFTLEDVSERAYFDTIGSVNLLGLPSNDEEDGSNKLVTESESRSIPMALVEHREGTYEYLLANESYLKLLKYWQDEMLDDVQDALSDGLFAVPDDLVHQIDQTGTRESETVQMRMVGDDGYHVHVRHVATGPNANAFVIAATPIS